MLPLQILIIEDDRDIATLVESTLTSDGFSCRLCHDGLQGLELAKDLQPDLIILDLLLPRLDGLELCARLRQKPLAKDPYILMLTAKSDEIDRIVGLSTGADDYLVKPFSPRELIARVRALLRRSLRQGGQTPIYRTSSFTLDPDQRKAVRHLGHQPPETLDLTTLEFNLLMHLMSQPGRVWQREQLIERVWGSDYFGDDRVVDTHIARLRKKVEPDPSEPRFIKTVIGVGYKFQDHA
nr:response regulator transcription factor [Thermostichus lividus]